MPLRALGRTLDLYDGIELLYALYDVLQLLGVLDIEREIDIHGAAGGFRVQVLSVDLHAEEKLCDLHHDAGPLVCEHMHRHGEGLRIAHDPFDGDYALNVEQQLLGVCAIAPVNGNASAPCDIAEDIVAGNGSTAAGKVDDHIVLALDDDSPALLVIAGAELLLALQTLLKLYLLLLLAVLLHKPVEHLARSHAAVAYRSIDIVKLVQCEALKYRRVILGFYEICELLALAFCCLCEHLAAFYDILFPVGLLEVLAYLRFGLGGLCVIDPIAAGSRLLVGDDLHDVVRLELMIELDERAVDLRVLDMIADVRMNAVREIYRRRARGQVDDLSRWGENVDVIGEEILLDVVDELPCGIRVALVIQKVPHPCELAVELVRPCLAFFIKPMRGNAVLSRAVHLLRADLYLKGHAEIGEQRRMQRPIHICLRHGDVILEPSRHGFPKGMNDAQCGVTVVDRSDNDPDRNKIVDLVKVFGVVAL